MYFISSWICMKSSKNLLVKIVYPGGRVEIHDHPIVAADVLVRHPKCCVAHPGTYAVVAPSTTLALGRKYYVVPLRTVRRLQLKLKSGSKRESEKGIELRNGGTRLSVAHLNQWQPTLESIVEE